MKKGLVLLFAFILTVAFSAEVFAGDAKTNFGVKKRDKEVVAQRSSQERVKEVSANKIPVVQPVAETTVAAVATVADSTINVTNAMYSNVVDNMMVKVKQMKQKPASSKAKAISEEPQKTKQAVNQELTQKEQIVSEAKPKEAVKTAEKLVKKERVGREVEPKRKSSNIK